MPVDGGRFLSRPLLADIGDGDGEDRRQHQPLHEAPEDQRATGCRDSAGHHGRDRQHEHGGDDDALAAEHVGDRAGERRDQRHRQRADAVMMAEIREALAPNSSDSSGRIACGE